MSLRSGMILVAALMVGCGGDGGAASASAGGSATPKPSAAASGKSTASAAATSATPAVAAPPSDVPSAVASANVTMEGAELDGFKMKTISCRAANANPLTAIAMLAPLAKQKAALDACVDKQVEVKVHVEIKDKKATDVRVAGAPSPEAAVCIAKALEAASWNEDLACVVAFDLKAGS